MSTFGCVLPVGIRCKIRVLRDALGSFKSYFGVSKRKCNLCGFEGYFLANGVPPRFDSRCPSCKSIERHRLLRLWLDDNERLFAQADILHFAPEKSVGNILRPLARSYKSADLVPGRADLALNIEHADVPDGSFDIVVCFHVLEHVNDALALSEIYRMLREGGFALIMVPIVEGWSQTYENGAIASAKDRELHFGQCDHVRYYGADVRNRIKSAGFVLDEFTATEPNVMRYGLIRGEKLFVARKAKVG